MTEETADSLYAQLRVRGQMTVGYHLFHLLPGVRYRAKRDGLIYGQKISFLSGRRERLNAFNRRQRSASFWLEDGRGNLVFPDAENAAQEKAR